MITAPDLAAAVGNTPLIRLNAISKATGCNIYGKAEFMNPGQSVKDRAALSIIRAAEADGSLRPGGTIVEGTAGNTGIGLALLVLLLLACARALLRERATLEASALGAVALFFVASQTSGSLYDTRGLWVFLFLAIAIAREAREEEARWTSAS